MSSLEASGPQKVTETDLGDLASADLHQSEAIVC